jgi:PRTRC genetic system protein E
MFETLKQFLERNTATLMLTAEGDRITVTVIPKPKSDSDCAALRTPLVITGTAEELDEGFASVLSGYVSAHKSLADQLAETQAVLDSAKKESAAKAVKTAVKSAPKAAVSLDELADEGDAEGDEEVGEVESKPAAVQQPVAVKPKAEVSSALDLASLL